MTDDERERDNPDDDTPDERPELLVGDVEVPDDTDVKEALEPDAKPLSGQVEGLADDD